MSGNPLTSSGSLNKLRGRVQLIDFPQLNVAPSNLGKQMIRLALEGPITTMIQNATSVSTSPEPYQMASVTMHLLKTQFLAELYRRQIELNSLIGDIVVVPDAAPLQPYSFSNCGIMGVQEMSFAGDDAGYVVTLAGTYYINSALWASA